MQLSQFLTSCEHGKMEEVTNLVELLEVDVNTPNEVHIIKPFRLFPYLNYSV